MKTGLFLLLALLAYRLPAFAVDEKKIVDMTYPFSAETMHWPTAQPFKLEKASEGMTPQGYWYADKKYLNFTLRFDYRFVRPKGLEDERDFIGNSGYFLFVTDHQVWPRMLQMEGGQANALAPAPLGATAKFTQDADARRRAVRPLDEWNSVEIVSKNGQVMGYLNGTLVSAVTEHDFKEPGYIGFQSETGEIHWRNNRIKPE